MSGEGKVCDRCGAPLRPTLRFCTECGQIVAPVTTYAELTRPIDDDSYVLSNPLVRGGLGIDGIAGAFTSTRGSVWIPLAWLSHMLDVRLFGLDPAGHHLTSIVLHAVNAVVLFAVLSRLTGAPVRSALVAALFALHPLRVESVAWIAERKDVLSACFGLLTLHAYVRFVERQKAEGRRQKAESGRQTGLGSDLRPPTSGVSPCLMPSSASPFAIAC